MATGTPSGGIYRVIALLALLIWTFFAIRGFDAIASIRAQGAPGYPNAAQRGYYLYVPLVVACVSLLLLIGSGRPRWRAPAGCLAMLFLALLMPYLLFYTGGV